MSFIDRESYKSIEGRFQTYIEEFAQDHGLTTMEMWFLLTTEAATIAAHRAKNMACKEVFEVMGDMESNS